MLDWAVTHRNEFYGEVYPRLLAKEGVSQHGQITVIVQRNPTVIDPNTTTCSVEADAAEGVSSEAQDNQ